MIGKYERGEAVPSLEVAKKIANAFDVTLNHRVEETNAGTIDKKTMQRIRSYRPFRRRSSDMCSLWWMRF